MLDTVPEKARRLVWAVVVSCGVGFSVAEVGPVSAEQTDERVFLQDIPSVYAASRYDQRVTEAPASVTIISAEEIKRYGYRTLADILRSVRSLTVTNDRNYSYLGLRGFTRSGDYNARLLIMVDGHRLNDPLYDGVGIGADFVLDVDLIERIEIVRGPGSSLYGSNALFGVINVITRNGRTFRAGEASGSLGSLDTYTGRLTLGHRFDSGLEPVLSGSSLTSQGNSRLFFREFVEPGVSDGVARDRDGERAYQLFAKAAWRDFTLLTAYNDRTKDVPTASYGTVLGGRERTTDALGFVDLAYDRMLAGSWRLSSRLAYDRYYYRGIYPYAAEDGSIVENVDPAVGQAVSGELQVTTTALPLQRLTLGGDFRYSFELEQRNFDRTPFLEYINSHETDHHWGVYAQDEVALRADLILNAGLRYDRYESFGDTVNPRLAIIYAPVTSTTVKALYGTAFRAPNAYERFYVAPTQKANPSLGPEEIETYELVVEQALGWNLHGTVAGFYYTLDDIINQETDPDDGRQVFRNSGRIRAKGIELELDGRWASGVSGRASYVYQNADDDRTGKPLAGTARHVAKLNTIIPLVRDRLFLGLEQQFQSRRLAAGKRSLSPAYLTNITLFSTGFPGKGVEFSLSVYNLFNTRYRDPVGSEFQQTGIEQDGRAFRLKLTYSF